MDEYMYFFWIAIVLIGFIILKKMAKIYIFDSDGNSVKTESSMMWQAYILLISGIIMIIAMFFSTKARYIIREVLFLSFCFLCAINFLWFLAILTKNITNNVRYKKTSNIKFVLYSHFLKNAILLYFLYNYYDLFIS